MNVAKPCAYGAEHQSHRQKGLPLCFEYLLCKHSSKTHRLDLFSGYASTRHLQTTTTTTLLVHSLPLFVVSALCVLKPRRGHVKKEGHNPVLSDGFRQATNRTHTHTPSSLNCHPFNLDIGETAKRRWLLMI